MKRLRWLLAVAIWLGGLARPLVRLVVTEAVLAASWGAVAAIVLAVALGADYWTCWGAAFGVRWITRLTDVPDAR